MAALADRPRAFIDTETTGLDPDNGAELLEVAIIREFPDGTVDEWCTKISPMHIETANNYALKVNGYLDHPELWVGAPTFAEVAPEVARRLKDCILIGHNVSFDLDFLNAALKLAGSPAKLPYHKIDTVTLAYVDLVPQGLTSLSLDNIRAFYGWSKDGAHTALVDTRDCRRLYHLIVNQVDIECPPSP